MGKAMSKPTNPKDYEEAERARAQHKVIREVCDQVILRGLIGCQLEVYAHPDNKPKRLNLKPPPADLVGALHDTIHQDLKEFQLAKSFKVYSENS